MIDYEKQSETQYRKQLKNRKTTAASRTRHLEYLKKTSNVGLGENQISLVRMPRPNGYIYRDDMTSEIEVIDYNSSIIVQSDVNDKIKCLKKTKKR